MIQKIVDDATIFAILDDTMVEEFLAIVNSHRVDDNTTVVMAVYITGFGGNRVL